MATWDKDVKQGAFVRKESSFRKWVTSDGAKDGFKAESGRYHLYVSYACPWAHRTLILLELKGLSKHISVTVVDPHLTGETGWHFSAEHPDPLHSFKYLKEVYKFVNPEYDGRITVPVLYDKKTNQIVNNESSEIIQMLNNQFNELSETREQASLDLYPEEFKSKIDEINDFVYHNINNGVYKCGFATTSEAYEAAFKNLFSALDKVEDMLSKSRYLSGPHLTLADIRLFTTLVRFDPVYHNHFKCNGRKLKEYKNLWGFTQELYQIPAVRKTVNIDHIKVHYYWSHITINPTRIVPVGPLNYEEDLMKEHSRHLIK